MRRADVAAAARIAPGRCPMRERAVTRRLALFAGVAWCAPLSASWAAPTQSWLPAPALPEATLLDQDGQPQRMPDIVTAAPAVVVQFFFSGCGTVCPPQTALLRELRQRIDMAGRAREVSFVSISVDPLGDGPSQLRAYAQRFGLRAGKAAGWTLLTGEQAVVARVLQGFGVAASAPQQHANVLWMGAAWRARWTRIAGLAPPDEMWRRLQEVMA